MSKYVDLQIDPPCFKNRTLLKRALRRLRTKTLYVSLLETITDYGTCVFMCG